MVLTTSGVSIQSWQAPPYPKYEAISQAVSSRGRDNVHGSDGSSNSHRLTMYYLTGGEYLGMLDSITGSRGGQMTGLTPCVYVMVRFKSNIIAIRFASRSFYSRQSASDTGSHRRVYPTTDRALLATSSSATYLTYGLPFPSFIYVAGFC